MMNWVLAQSIPNLQPKLGFIPPMIPNSGDHLIGSSECPHFVDYGLGIIDIVSLHWILDFLSGI